MPASHPLLRLEQVSKVYRASEGSPAVPVLRAITLELARGETLAITGPSGSGKSTLLNIIGTLDRPSEGRVLLEGVDLGGLDENKLAALRSRHIGFIFQSHHLLPHCSAWENVLLPTLALPTAGRKEAAAGDPQKTGTETPEARAERLLKRVGLGDRLHHRPGHLSGGERQRVAVVRALINRPELLLADEPTGSLDHAAAESLGQLLVELNREEAVTLIVVTHALDLARRMGRVLELRDGALQGGNRRPE
jgi:lipoprotein-releasing system ATP-binding protein